MKHAGSLALLLALAAPAAALQGAGPWVESSIGASEHSLPMDVDGDGDLDLFSSSGWFENDAGDASVWSAHAAPVIFPLAEVDLDRDGDPDVLGRTGWLENAAGDGSAWSAHAIPAAPNPISIRAAADLDGDADVDAISFVLEQGTATIAWIENASGDGSTWTWRAIGSFVPDMPDLIRTLVPTDVDDDGDLDVVSTRNWEADPCLVWWENTAGDGSAWTERPIASTLLRPFDLASADFDGDGNLDVLATRTYFVSTCFLFRNTAGDGSVWVASNPMPGFVGNIRRLRTADLDRDGDEDFLVDRTQAGLIGTTWLENISGDGSSFVDHHFETVNAAAGGRIFAVDLDGDGDPDVVRAFRLDATTTSIEWWRNEAPGAPAVFCGESVVASLASAAWVTSADLDGDGDTDVISASDFAPGFAWHENLTGDGSTWSHTTIGPGEGPAELFPADLDGDGDSDVVAAFVGSTNSFSWFENEQLGTAWTEHPVDGAYHADAAAADVDGDGDLDLFGAAWLTFPQLRWYENVAGDGSVWTTHAMHAVAEGRFEVAAGDVDRDGDQDLLTANASGVCSWRENAAGDGSAWVEHAIGTELVGGTIEDVEAADVDGNGTLDLIVAGLGAGHLNWYSNDAGDGSAWTLHPIPNTSLGAWDLSPVDLDADGDVDVLASYQMIVPAPLPMAWLENADGAGGVWIEKAFEQAAPFVFHAEPADVDGDGDLDVLRASNGAANVSWYEHVRAAAIETVRLGVPPNPDALRPGLTSGPVLGGTWDPWVDHASFQPDAVFDVLGVSLGALNIPTSYGTVLCTPPIATAVNAASVPFAIAITEDCALLGVTFCIQAASWNGTTLEATNALDVTLGTY